MIGRNIFCILCLFTLFFSCKKGNTEHNISDKVLTYSGDTVFLSIDSFKYTFTKAEFEFISDNLPEKMSLNTTVENPDSAHSKYQANNTGYSFGSEAGQDQFYILYTYFLRQKAEDKYKEERDNLIKIYRNLNEIYGEINRGGTYFGHMFVRIVGYVEYELYCCFPEQEDDSDQDFSSKKQEFIKSLQENIDENIKAYSEIDENLNQANLQYNIDQLNNLLTNGFYLRKVQRFKDKHYDF